MIDIRSWGASRIMQLPDEAFGEHRLIFHVQVVGIGVDEYHLVDDALPERFVLWSILIGGNQPGGSSNGVKIALGDQQPADEAAFNAMERLFPGKFDEASVEGLIGIPWITTRLLPMRKFVFGGGRKFVVLGRNAAGSGQLRYELQFEISSVPGSIEEWLVGLPDESLRS